MRENAISTLFTLLMGEGVCQLAVPDRPTQGPELTFESIPVSEANT